MYRINKQQKARRRRRLIWLIIILLLLVGGWFGYHAIKQALRPQTTVTQSKATRATISYDAKTKHYDEPNFGIDVPVSWQPVARPAGPYQTYTWQTSLHGSDGQSFQIFEDTIPVNFAVNKVLIVSGEGDHLVAKGQASDNCALYTINPGNTQNKVGGPARWQGVDFLCDASNQQRDVTGTSSTDGVNSVVLKSASTGQSHRFFFTYTAQGINPDYTLFYGAVQSLKMQ